MGARGRSAVPLLDRQQLQELLVSVADIIVMLDDDYVISGVTDPMNLDNLTLWNWIGRKVVDVTAPDSLPKLSRLLREEGFAGPASDRWRHINFLDAAGGNVPLLVKYFHIAAGPVTTRLLIGRDLRPMEEVQQRFQKALDEFQTRPEPECMATQAAYNASSDVDDLIGRKPFDQIVMEATDILQRTFFAEALKRAHGDTAAAARLLCLDEADFLARLRKEGAA
jgi:hypothetical protein